MQNVYSKPLFPLLTFVLMGFLALGGLTSIMLDPPLLQLFHGLLEISSLILGFFVFFICWYGTGTFNSARVTVISLIILCSAVFELIHFLTFPHMLLADLPGCSNIWVSSWVISRIIWSFGLLYALLIPDITDSDQAISRKTLLTTTLMATMGLVATTVFGFNPWPYLTSSYLGQPVALYAQYFAFFADLIAVVIVFRQSPNQAGHLPLLALLFGALADFSFSLAVHSSVSLNVPGHVFKALANLYILRTLYVYVIKHPFEEVIRLKENMEELAQKNANLYKESERQHGLFEDVLAKVGMIISSQLDRKETLDAIADMVADMMGARQSAIALFNKSRTSLQVMATYGINAPPEQIPLRESLAAEVCQKRTAICLDDLTLHPEIFRPQLIFTSIRSIISAPLINDKEIIGVMEAYSNTKGAFSERDVRLLSALGYHAGAALSSATLYEQTKLRLSEEQFLYQIAQAAAVTIDTDHIMQQCASHAARALGADLALGFLFDESAQTYLTFRAAYGVNCKFDGFAITDYPHLAELVHSSIPSAASPDIFPLLKTLCPDDSYEQLLLLPLPVDSRLLGLIILGWQRQASQENTERMSFAALMAQQIALGLEKAHLYNQVKAMALSDGLTGLANRRNFDMFLNTELRRATSLKRQLSLLMLDLDKFKVYNDTYGHPTGDRLLAQLGKILQQTVRSIDFPARYGGEEFAVILPECNNVDGTAIAEKIRQAVEAAHFPDNAGGLTARITASFGLATYDPTITTPPDAAKFISIADQALYNAKEQGRNRVVSSTVIN